MSKYRELGDFTVLICYRKQNWHQKSKMKYERKQRNHLLWREMKIKKKIYSTVTKWRRAVLLPCQQSSTRCMLSTTTQTHCHRHTTEPKTVNTLTDTGTSDMTYKNYLLLELQSSVMGLESARKRKREYCTFNACTQTFFSWSYQHFFGIEKSTLKLKHTWTVTNSVTD